MKGKEEEWRKFQLTELSLLSICLHFSFHPSLPQSFFWKGKRAKIAPLEHSICLALERIPLRPSFSHPFPKSESI